jgi:hypothetical protein
MDNLITPLDIYGQSDNPLDIYGHSDCPLMGNLNPIDIYA